MIKSLYLQNYKQFDKKRVEFKSGFNILIGKNEKGKSTVLNGLFDCFYQDATTRSTKYLDSVRPIDSDSSDMKLSIIMQDEHKREFLLERDFNKKNNLLRSVSENKDLTNDPNKIQQFLTNTFGIPNEKVLRNTIFIGQTEILKLKLNSDLKSELQNISSINTNNDGIQDRLKKLEQELRELTLGLSRPSKNPGKILNIQNKIKSLESDLNIAKDKLNKALSAKQEEQTSGDKLQEIEKNINEIEQRIENHKNSDNFQKRLKEISPSLEQMTGQVNSIDSSKSQLKNLIAQKNVFSEVFNNKETLEKDAAKISEIKQSIKLYEERLTEKKELKSEDSEIPQLNYLQASKGELETSIYINLGFIILFASAVGLLIGIFSSTEVVTNISIFTGVISIILFIFGNIKKITNKKRKIEVNSETIPKNEDSEIQNIQIKINSLNSQVNEIITKYGVADSIEFFTTKAKLISIDSEIEKLKSLISGLLGNQEYKELKNAQLKLIEEKNQLENKINSEEIKNAKLSPNEYLKIRRELDMLNLEKRKLSKNEAQNNVRANEMGISPGEVRDMEEELSILEDEYKIVTERKTILEQTIRLVKLSLKMTSKNLNKSLAELDKDFLKEITAGNYSDIRLSDDYEVSIKDKGDRWIRPEDYLSQGAMEQIYFILRLLIAQLLLPKNKINYIFLDDPFVNFDRERLSATEKIINNFKENTQIILVTHDENYKNWNNANIIAI